MELADNSRKTMCSMCRKSFHFSNVGIQAVRSHAKTKKHLAQVKSVAKQLQISSFLTKVLRIA